VIDPACDGLLGVYLFYKGVHALACARVANHYWEERGETGRLIAKLLQSEMADVFGVAAWSKCRLGSAPARLLRLPRARPAALGSSVLPGRGRPARRPATALSARANRLQSRRSHRL
jgi:hypothetical protein